MKNFMAVKFNIILKKMIQNGKDIDGLEVNKCTRVL